MILITRPKEQSKDLELLLTSKGYETYQESLYNFKYHKNKIAYDKNNYYIFPSIHSVKSLISSKQIYKFKNANIFAIGKKVKQALIKLGCKKVLAVSEDSESLIKILNTQINSKSNFIYFGSNIINKDFFIKAKKNKLNIQKKTIYKTLPSKKLSKHIVNNLKLNKVRGIVFYSLLSVDTFLNLISKYKILSDVKKINTYSISERVAKPLRQYKFKYIYIARRPNQTALVKSIKKAHASNVL